MRGRSFVGGVEIALSRSRSASFTNPLCHAYPTLMLRPIGSNLCAAGSKRRRRAKLESHGLSRRSS
jgi:hypothetical protein